MSKPIESLNIHQRWLLRSIAERIRSFPLSTAPANRALAEEGIRQIYDQIGMTPPSTIMWFDSPIGAANFLLKVPKIKLGRNIEDLIPWRFAAWESGQIYCHVSNLIAAEVSDLFQTAWAEVTPAFINKYIWLQDWRFRSDPVSFEFVLAAAQYEFFRNCGLAETPSAQALSKVVWNSDYWWPFANVAILVDRPTVIRWDQSWRLHAESGPAVQYRDSTCLYFDHGRRIPGNIAERPEEITLERINTERNVEIRRIIINQYKRGEEISGAGRFVRDSNSRILDHDEKWGTLHRLKIPDDEPVVVLQVINGSREPDGTFKQYWLRVPPDMTTALDAVAWTYGLTGVEYEKIQGRT